MTLNNLYSGAFSLIIAAVGLLALATATGRGDITTASLVLAGASCFITGVFLLALHKGEPISPEIAALLPAQGTIGIATLCADLGVQGDAWFIPEEDGTVVEIIPVTSAPPVTVGGDYSYITREDGCAVRLVPVCTPLLRHLQDKYALEIPKDDNEGLLACIEEVCDTLLEISGKTTAARDGANIIVTLNDYHLVPGCQAIREVSPKCCTMVGCPICSLLAAIAAIGIGTPTKIEHVALDERRKSLRVILRPESAGGPGPGVLG